MKKTYNSAFKAKVVLEVLKEENTIAEISSKYGVSANQISIWKKQVIEKMPEIFSGKRGKKEKSGVELESELYKQIGQLKVELDWLKKKSGLFD
jgi:transposase